MNIALGNNLFHRPPHPKTGEVFVMREPQDEDGRSCWRIRNDWNVLKIAIEHLGGEVRVVPPCAHEEERGDMYTRDPGVLIPREGMPSLYLRAKGKNNAAISAWESRAVQLHREGKGITKDIRDVADTRFLDGEIEGGNIIYDPARHVLFWGVNNVSHIEADYPELGGVAPEHETPEQKLRRIEHAKPNAEAWQSAQHLLDACYQKGELGTPIRVVPMFIPDKNVHPFYHLDGCMNVLPTGQVVVCPEVLSYTAMNALNKVVGKQNLILVDIEQAVQGATNFITVGHSIITPYAPFKLRQRFEKLGYEVVTPKDAGLKVSVDSIDGMMLTNNPWVFGPMGAVRCATLKVTPDIGFPQEQSLSAGRQL